MGSYTEAAVPKSYRVVLDPGVLIAALITSKGARRELLWSWLEGGFQLGVYPALLVAPPHVLPRPKFPASGPPAAARAFLARPPTPPQLHPNPPIHPAPPP